MRQQIMRGARVLMFPLPLVLMFQFALSLGLPTLAHADRDPAIDAMQAALDQWLLDAEFACDYTYRLGEAASIDGGLDGDWTSVDELRCFHGALCKGLGMVRISMLHAGPPVLVGKSDDTAEYLNINVDEVASSEVGLSYSPSPEGKQTKGLARIAVRERLEARSNGLGRYDAGGLTKRRLSPLAIDGNEIGSYLSANGIGQPAAETAVLETTQEHIVIRIGFVSGTYKVTKDVRFSLKHQHPVVDEIRTVMDDEAGSRFEIAARATQFVDVKGIPIATVIRNATSGSGAVRVAEWSAAGGLRSPIAKDFLVPIAEKTRVRGVRDAKRFITNGMLDISKVRHSDVTTVYEDELVGGRRKEAPTHHTGPEPRVFLTVSSTLFLLIIGAIAWMSRRGSHEE